MAQTYLTWNEKKVDTNNTEAIEKAYGTGFVATRINKDVFQQTRSLRINLASFDLTSENRRVLKKTEGVEMHIHPLPFAGYDWSIGKLGKDFYTEKFGDGTFSANKIKELLTDKAKSNFNRLLTFSFEKKIIGYAICLETSELLHYSYPFYDLNTTVPNLGLGMMLRAMLHAKDNGKKYIYLGSFQRPTDTYKLQFKGLEWFDGKEWQTNTDQLKILS